MARLETIISRPDFGKGSPVESKAQKVFDAWLRKGKDAMTPRQRDQVLSDFIQKRTTRLVSTDVIGRGIDIPDVTHVISIELPKQFDKVTPDPEAYLQRVGRAGRMGRKGVAINFQTKYDGAKLKHFEEYYDTQIVEMPADYAEHLG